MTVSEIKKYIFEKDLIILVLENIGMHMINNNGNYISCAYPDGDNPKGCIVYLNEFLNATSYTREIDGKFNNLDIVDLVNYVCKFNNMHLAINKVKEICNINYSISSNKFKTNFGNDIFKKYKNRSKKMEKDIDSFYKFFVDIFDNKNLFLNKINDNIKYLYFNFTNNNGILTLKSEIIHSLHNKIIIENQNITKKNDFYILIQDESDINIVFRIEKSFLKLWQKSHKIIYQNTAKENLSLIESFNIEELLIKFNKNTKIKYFTKIVDIIKYYLKTNIVFDKNILDYYYSRPHINLFYEGILPETCKYFNIKFDIENNRIIFPHFNLTNTKEILALVGRTTNPFYKELNISKYLITVGVGYKKGSNLYGLAQNYNDIKKEKRIIIFEAEKSVLKSWQMGYKIGVSVGCHDLTKEQIKVLLSLNVEEVIIAFDKDVELEHLIEIIDIMKYYFKVTVIYDKYNVLDDKDSPVDKGKKIFDILYKYRNDIKELRNIYKSLKDN